MLFRANRGFVSTLIADFEPAICNFEAKKATMWSPLRSSDPDGGQGGMQYLADEFFPVNAPPYLSMVWTGKIHSEHRQKMIVQYNNNKSLRQLAHEYGVSHETIRRILKAEW